MKYSNKELEILFECIGKKPNNIQEGITVAVQKISQVLGIERTQQSLSSKYYSMRKNVNPALAIGSQYGILPAIKNTHRETDEDGEIIESILFYSRKMSKKKLIEFFLSEMTPMERARVFLNMGNAHMKKNLESLKNKIPKLNKDVKHIQYVENPSSPEEEDKNTTVI